MADRHLIPWAKPSLWAREEEYVLEALRSTWISGGPFVERLEKDIAAYLGCKHAVAVANGTAALHLAYLALDLAPGDDIVVPGFSFMAAANIALHLKARPVFCDVDPETWCMRAADVAAVLTGKTRAIVAVHTYGNVCEISALLALARERGIPIIEDAAEAFGSCIAGRPAGSLGNINTFSFHATKTITTGEGGLVATDDDAAAEAMRLYRNHGLRRKRHYWHEVPGHNFRLTNLQAALGCAQLESIERIIAERRRVFVHYQQRLSTMPGIALQRLTEGCEPLVWAVAVRLSADVYPQGRDAVIAAMASEGIETRPGFQPPAEMSYFEPAQLPTSEMLGRWVLSLPTYPMLAGCEIERVCNQLAALGQGTHT
jgi:perosamine synthetase